MKKLFLSLIVLLFVPIFLNAQADKIAGFWNTAETENGFSQVEIIKNSNGTYSGKIIWLKIPLEDGKPKVDDENPDPKLQNRPIMGLPIVNDFLYNSKKEKWQEGNIYDPESGKTYDCYAWFEDGDYNTLHLKGYVMGIKALGRSTEWTRDKKRE